MGRLNSVNMRLPSLQIVIVNRNSGTLVRRCVESITAAEREGFALKDVAVVDDGSSDGSCDKLPADGLPLRVLRRPRSGYGASCNAGVTGSDADYILFLNTDLFLEKETLSSTVAFLERPENAGVGILGIQLRYPDGRIAAHCRNFPGRSVFLRESLGLHLLRKNAGGRFMDFDHKSTREVDQILGAYMLMRGDVFRSLGGYDERFFVYYEDLDLSMRARRARWRTVFYADVWATHLENATAKSVWAESIFFSLRSKMLYIGKWFGLSWALLFFPIIYGIEPALRACMAAARGFGRQLCQELKAWASLWLNLPVRLLAGPRKNWPFE
jgi:hypothetical protein